MSGDLLPTLTGAAANWDTSSYGSDDACNIKAMGWDSFVHDGVHALAFEFDRAERLVKISQAGANKLPTAVNLKEYSYATTNGAGDLANGKLKWAWTKNTALVGSTDPAMTAEVKETYTYL